MKEAIEFQLVKGTFNLEEAKEVLFSLLNSKIKYHQQQAFSISERNAGSITYSENRIEELNQAREKVIQFMNQQFEEGNSVQINGIISIKVMQNHV
ncbi:MAG: hypothetical protein CMP76_06165 [Flavobacterium sp.]|uniref:hypothetical protein n=1 Tax=Flavobacterium sp. TaxID=239 RepID=UPI000C57EF6B|nr:hypothetical protein [Flavobacterium sp.]MBF02863.1 hypothetical protein [Flavobacterium sp.]|tara:strand:+ start:167 stop:454 length:288 start_codon:yes stop_codon:yes gene_type:complete